MTNALRHIVVESGMSADEQNRVIDEFAAKNNIALTWTVADVDSSPSANIMRVRNATESDSGFHDPVVTTHPLAAAELVAAGVTVFYCGAIDMSIDNLKFSLGRLVSIWSSGAEIGQGLLRWEDGYNRYKVGSLWFLASDVVAFNEATRIITLKNPPAGGAKWQMFTQ